MKVLRDRVFAVTGAASGIGRALAQALAREGATVEVSDRNEAELGTLLEELRSAGANAYATTLDVADRGGVHAWADAIVARHGAVHAIVNNAGVAMAVHASEQKIEDFEWLMNINFWGVVHGTQAFLPHLQKVDEAHIVNISSIFGVVGVPTQSAYNASKFAVRGYTESLRQELLRSHIGVTCVHPGGIDTNIVRSARVEHAIDGKPISRDQLAKEFKRNARTTPEQAADKIVGAIRSRQARLLIGADAHALSWLSRVFPESYPHVLLRLVNVTRRQQSK